MNTRRRSAMLLLAIACLAAVASGCGGATSTTTERVTTPARLLSLIRQSYRIADSQVRDGQFPGPQQLADTLDRRLSRRHVVVVVSGAAGAYGDRLVIDTRSGPDRLLIEGRVGAIVAQAFQRVGELPVVRYVAVRHAARRRDTHISSTAFEDGFWIWLAVFARGPSEPFSAPVGSFSTSYANPAQTAVAVAIEQHVDEAGVPEGVEEAERRAIADGTASPDADHPAKDDEDGGGGGDEDEDGGGEGGGGE